MNFTSDTLAPVHPSVIDALAAANIGMEPSYGDDSQTLALRPELARIFETDDFDYYLVSSGTAANALTLSLFCPPMGAILCHDHAHIAVDERSAPEFYTGGGKLYPLPGTDGKIDRSALEVALTKIDHDFVHETPAHVLALTNLTESGTAYTAEEIAQFTQLAKSKNLAVHLDGARLGNALVHLNATPADMTWRAGVDALSFGLTKTGAMGCEIIMLFGSARTKFSELKARAKRGGHMPAKMRFIAAQARALLKNDLWLELSAMANARAADLAEGFTQSQTCHLASPCNGNEVFVNMPATLAKELTDAGAKFYPWPDGSYRFVTAWTTPQSDVNALLQHVT